MDLFDFEKDDIAEAQPTQSIDRTEPVRLRAATGSSKPSQAGQSLLETIIMIIAAIILVILLVLLGRWIYHAAHHTNQTTNTSSQQSASQSSNNSSSSPSNSASSSPASGSNSSNSSTAPSSKNGLPNSGPGDTLAIFAGTTLVVASIHYAISLRRFNRSN